MLITIPSLRHGSDHYLYPVVGKCEKTIKDASTTSIIIPGNTSRLDKGSF